MATKEFAARHIGPDTTETEEMLKEVGVDSMEQLISETIPTSIRLKSALRLPPALSEYRFLQELKKTASTNQIFKSYIGRRINWRSGKKK